MLHMIVALKWLITLLSPDLAAMQPQTCVQENFPDEAAPLLWAFQPVLT